MNKIWYETGNQKLHNFGFPTIKEFKQGDKKMEKTNNWNKIEDTIFKFEKDGDSIEGILMAKEDGRSYGNEVYKIKKDEKIFSIFSTVVLASQMSKVNIGEEIKIVFMGEKENDKKGQNNIKLFEVYKR